MQTSIATVSLSGGLAEKLEATAAAGFTGVEIFESDLLSFNGTPKDVARMVAELGLRIVTFQPFRDFEGMPEPQRSRTFARAERKFDLMSELGCDLLMICSNVAPGSLGECSHADRVQHLVRSAQLRAGIRPAVLAAQPFAVHQMGASELRPEPGAAEPVDRFAIQILSRPGGAQEST